MERKKKLTIAVLMGGHSAEREVSLATGAGVVEGLRKAGHNAFGIDTAFGAENLNPENIGELSKIDKNPPTAAELEKLDHTSAIRTITSQNLQNVDMAFIALHGGIGENGTIQALLDSVGVPYTGSGVLASAVAMDKLAAKRIVSSADVPTPEYLVKRSSNIGEMPELIDMIEKEVGFPVVVKPNDQGSSVGLGIASSAHELEGIVEIAKKYSDKVLFEKYIEGRELTVGILGDKPLPVAEVLPRDGFYDYRHKYTPGLSDKIIPARISEKETKKIQRLALEAFDAIGCRGYARIDFRRSSGGELFFLEANTLPGMTATSLVPKAALAAGIEFHQLLEKIVLIALDDYRKGKPE